MAQRSRRVAASEAIAEAAGVSRRLVEQGRQVQKHDPALLDEVAAGTKSIKVAVREIAAHGGEENGALGRPFSTEAEHSVMLDDLGHQVPPQLRAAFNVTAAVKDAIRQHVGPLRKLLKALANDLDGGIYLQKALVSIDASLKSAAVEAKSASPFTVCPACAGEKCPRRNGRGWITSDVFRGQPSKIRARHIEQGKAGAAAGRQAATTKPLLNWRSRRRWWNGRANPARRGSICRAEGSGGWELVGHSWPQVVR